MNTLKFRHLIFSVIIFFLTGCSSLEKAPLVTQSSKSMDLRADVAPNEALNAFKAASLRHFVFGKPTVTFRSKNTLEVGPWRNSNVAGYKGKVEINSSTRQLKFTIKGTGPYYSKLPVLSPSSPLKRAYVNDPIEHTANKILTELKANLNK